PIAQALDAAHQTTDYSESLRAAQALMQQADLLPSARVLAVMAQDFGNSFAAFTRAQSLQTKSKLLALPFSSAQQARFAAIGEQSLQNQKAIEAADSMPFEVYRQQYVSPERLGLSKAAIAPTLAAV
ncbi:MAG: glutamate--cysteine ligase, partial [Ramlibacter sp.]|nr:glutamate--cysteine ligase [Ramlibacter sp.]